MSYIPPTPSASTGTPPLDASQAPLHWTLVCHLHHLHHIHHIPHRVCRAQQQGGESEKKDKNLRQTKKIGIIAT